ncbi:hypothetical protein EYF80_028370 [Liparis tanakae]|uniref:Uncharacterized protein n=1 Tax=Liparis tanakae TaxID=230148 RepID=A0A4Z2H8K5_9TELE|nr:hypothetical protein EYF80_028370 [Liparis tanakae]
MRGEEERRRGGEAGIIRSAPRGLALLRATGPASVHRPERPAGPGAQAPRRGVGEVGGALIELLLGFRAAVERLRLQSAAGATGRDVTSYR